MSNKDQNNRCGSKHTFNQYCNAMAHIDSLVRDIAESGDDIPVMPLSLQYAASNIKNSYKCVLISTGSWVGVSRNGGAAGLSETSWYIFNCVSASYNCCMAFKFDASNKAKSFDDIIPQYSGFTAIRLGAAGSVLVSYAELRSRYANWEFYPGEKLECDCIQHVFSYDKPNIVQSGFISGVKNYYGINPSISSAITIASLVFNGKVSSNDWVYKLKSNETGNSCIGDEFLYFSSSRPVSQTGFYGSITELNPTFKMTRHPCEEDASYLSKCINFGIKKIGDYIGLMVACGDEYFGSGPREYYGSYDIAPTQFFEVKDDDTSSLWGWNSIVIPGIVGSPAYFNVSEKLTEMCMCGIFEDMESIFNKIKETISGLKSWDKECIPRPSGCFDGSQVAKGANTRFNLISKTVRINLKNGTDLDGNPTDTIVGVSVETTKLTPLNPYYVISRGDGVYSGCDFVKRSDVNEISSTSEYFFMDYYHSCVVTPEGVDICLTTKCEKQE